MNRTGWTPRAGSLPARVIEHLQQAEAGTELTVQQIAELFDAKANSVATCLRPAVAADALAFRSIVSEGVRRHAYSLPSEDAGAVEAEQAEHNTGPLEILDYSDGDVVVSGATVGEDGRVLFKPHQLLQLVDHATTTPAERAARVLQEQQEAAT